MKLSILATFEHPVPDQIVCYRGPLQEAASRKLDQSFDFCIVLEAALAADVLPNCRTWKVVESLAESLEDSMGKVEKTKARVVKDEVLQGLRLHHLRVVKGPENEGRLRLASKIDLHVLFTLGENAPKEMTATIGTHRDAETTRRESARGALLVLGSTSSSRHR